MMSGPRCGRETGTHRIEDFSVGIGAFFTEPERRFVCETGDVRGSSQTAETGCASFDADAAGQLEGVCRLTGDELAQDG